MAAQADFDQFFEVAKVLLSRKGRRKNRMNSAECDVANMKDMFVSNLSKEAVMFSRDEGADGRNVERPARNRKVKC